MRKTHFISLHLPITMTRVRMCGYQRTASHFDCAAAWNEILAMLHTCQCIQSLVMSGKELGINEKKREMYSQFNRISLFECNNI